MAEMTQFRQEISASEKANLSAMGDISIALETALAHEREKAEQERNNLTSEIVSLINAVLDGQHARWSAAVENAKQDLSASQSHVHGGYQLVSKGLDSWADREGLFTKKLLNNKDEVKKSIIEASKVCITMDYAYDRRPTSAALQYRRVQNEFMRRPLNLWTVRWRR